MGAILVPLSPGAAAERLHPPRDDGGGERCVCSDLLRCKRSPSVSGDRGEPGRRRHSIPPTAELRRTDGARRSRVSCPRAHCHHARTNNASRSSLGSNDNRIRYAVSNDTVGAIARRSHHRWLTCRNVRSSRLRRHCSRCAAARAARNGRVSCAAGATLVSNAGAVIWSVGRTLRPAASARRKAEPHPKDETSTDRIF